MDLQDLDELRALLKNQGLISAVKAIRERTGLGLKDAKDLAELIQRGAGIFEVSAALGGTWRATPQPPTPAAAMGEVERLVAQGKKIEAIKLYREQTGLGLRESKDAIDAIAAGRPAAAQSARPADASGKLSEVKRLAAQGRKIEAIKLYREIHNVGLKEAKDAVEAMA